MTDQRARAVHFREVRFEIRRELTDEGEVTWWATSPELGRFTACGPTKGRVMALCREALGFHQVTADQVVFVGPTTMTDSMGVIRDV